MNLSYLEIDNYFERNFRNGTELIEHQIISNFFLFFLTCDEFTVLDFLWSHQLSPTKHC